MLKIAPYQNNVKFGSTTQPELNSKKYIQLAQQLKKEVGSKDEFFAKAIRNVGGENSGYWFPDLTQEEYDKVQTGIKNVLNGTQIDKFDKEARKEHAAEVQAAKRTLDDLNNNAAKYIKTKVADKMEQHFFEIWHAFADETSRNTSIAAFEKFFSSKS